jgi:hypothetical protein
VVVAEVVAVDSHIDLGDNIQEDSEEVVVDVVEGRARSCRIAEMVVLAM